MTTNLSSPIAATSDPVRAVYNRLGLRGRIALVVGVLATIALAWWLSTLTWALMLPAMSTDSAQADEQRRLAELEEKFSQQIAQFNGRTVFYIPAPPVDEPAKVEEDTPKDGPAPPPATYGGPSIIATVNDVLWFSDGTRVKVGESSGDIKVVSLRAPWEATIEWKGKEFKVPFFDRDSVVLAKNKSESSSSLAPVAPSSSEPPAADSSAAKGAASDAKPAEPKPDQPKPDQPKPDQPKPAEPGSSDPKQGEPKPGEPPQPPPSEGPPPPPDSGNGPNNPNQPPSEPPAEPVEPKSPAREGTR